MVASSLDRWPGRRSFLASPHSMGSSPDPPPRETDGGGTGGGGDDREERGETKARIKYVQQEGNTTRGKHPPPRGLMVVERER